MAVSPFIRQLLVVGACELASLSAGIAQGYPMVLLLQLKEDNSAIKINLDTATWIGSIHGFSGILSIFLSILMQWKGRKIAFRAGCVIALVGWVLAFAAKSVAYILISETFHGCAITTISSISYLTLSEMTSPKYRNYAVQSCTVLHGIGVATSGILSRFLDWRTYCLLPSAVVIVALILSLLWPESPPWLACQGRFNECKEAFKQLRHMSGSSKKELEELIVAQEKSLSAKKNKSDWSLSSFWKRSNKREFYLPMVHILILLILTYWSGTSVFIINNLDLMQKTTKNDKAIYFGGIITNVVIILGILSSNILSHRFNNKTIVLGSAACGVTCLIGLIIATLLQDFNAISKELPVCPFLIVAFVAVVTPGMLSVVFTIVSEIMPVKYRGMGGVLYVIFSSILYSSTLKVSPYLFLYINLWGTFLLYSLNAFVCGLLIWRFVPETKNKTLQQIEDFYTFGKFDENRMKSNIEEPFL